MIQNNKVSVVLFFISEDMTYVKNAIDRLIQQYKNISFLYVLSNISTSAIKSAINNVNVSCILQKELPKRKYDYLLICGGKTIGVKLIRENLSHFNFDEEKIMYDWIVCIPGYTKNKYDKLRKSQLSIVSMNCFGGIISHILGLQFLSPFINMFFSEKDFLKILKNFNYYMKKEINFVRMDYEPNLKREYPVFEYDDGIILNMNHYTNADNAKKIWYERCKRINYYNIVVVMYTDDKNVLKEFDALPFSKKICFVPFETDIECAFTVNMKNNELENLPMWQCANYYASKPFMYDVFDLLTYGIFNKV